MNNPTFIHPLFSPTVFITTGNYAKVVHSKGPVPWAAAKLSKQSDSAAEGITALLTFSFQECWAVKSYILPAFSRHLSDFNCSTVNNSPSQQLSFNRSSACLTFPWAVASRKAYRVLPGSSQVSSEQKGIEAFSVAPTGFHCHSWSNRLNSPVVNKDSKAKVIRNGCFTTLLPLIPGKLLRLWSSAPLK